MWGKKRRGKGKATSQPLSPGLSWERAGSEQAAANGDGGRMILSLRKPGYSGRLFQSDPRSILPHLPTLPSSIEQEPRQRALPAEGKELPAALPRSDCSVSLVTCRAGRTSLVHS